MHWGKLWRAALSLAIAVTMAGDGNSAERECLERVAGVCLKFGPVEQTAPPQNSFSPAQVAEQQLRLSRDARRQIQRALKADGHYQGQVDGAFGPGTRRGIRSFQVRRGIDPTGFLDQAIASELIQAGRANANNRASSNGYNGSQTIRLKEGQDTIDASIERLSSTKARFTLKMSTSRTALSGAGYRDFEDSCEIPLQGEAKCTFLNRVGGWRIQHVSAQLPALKIADGDRTLELVFDQF